jgi:hypothetical protein
MRLDRERQRVNGAMGAFPFRYRKISKAGFYPICRPRRPQTRPQPVTTPTYGPTTPESYPPAPRTRRARRPDNRKPASDRHANLAARRNHRETARTTNRDATLNNRNQRVPGGVGGRSPPPEQSDGGSAENPAATDDRRAARKRDRAVNANHGWNLDPRQARHVGTDSEPVCQGVWVGGAPHWSKATEDQQRTRRPPTTANKVGCATHEPQAMRRINVLARPGSNPPGSKSRPTQFRISS